LFLGKILVGMWRKVWDFGGFWWKAKILYESSSLWLESEGEFQSSVSFLKVQNVEGKFESLMNK
jgi:hypothetical protein